MRESLETVHYAESPWEAPGRRVFQSALPFEETLAGLKAALVEENLWLIHEIDPQTLLERGGYCIRPARQLLFFHPRYMARLLEGNPSAVVEVPLKLVIMEGAGGAVTLLHPDVREAFSHHPGLETLGGELASIYERLIDAVVGKNA